MKLNFKLSIFKNKIYKKFKFYKNLIISYHLAYLEWCHLVLLASIPVFVTGSYFPKLPIVLAEVLINLLLSCILSILKVL